MARASSALVVLFLLGSAFAADPPALHFASGRVEKVEKDSLTIQPRETTGKFGKQIALKITGTSKVSTLSIRETGGKSVVVQRDTEARDLKTGQAISVIYTTLKD